MERKSAAFCKVVKDLLEFVKQFICVIFVTFGIICLYKLGNLAYINT